MGAKKKGDRIVAEPSVLNLLLTSAKAMGERMVDAFWRFK